MKYIIIGRTCSGKKTLLKDLKKHGIKVNRSFTTNPNANLEIYEIITSEQAEKIKNKILITNIDDYIYFTTEDNLTFCDVISLDINGLKQICELYPNNIFRIINVQMADDDRLRAFISKIPQKEKITAEEDFINRFQSENADYDELEKTITSARTPYGFSNIITMHALLNDATNQSAVFDFWQTIKAGLNSFERMSSIVADLMYDSRIRYLHGSDNNLLIEQCIFTDEEKTEIKNITVPFEQFVESVLSDVTGIGYTLSCWVNLDDISASFEPAQNKIAKLLQKQS